MRTGAAVAVALACAAAGPCCGGAPLDKPPGFMGGPIPGLLAQSHRSFAAVSEKRKAAMKKWLELNALEGLQHRFFSDSECLAYVRESCGGDAAWAYTRLRPGEFRADLFRYCYLWREGGFWADADLVPAAPLRAWGLATPWSDVQFVATAEKPELPGAVHQAFMAAAPGLDFFGDAVAAVVSNVRTGYYPSKSVDWWEGALNITGPSLLGRVVNARLGRKLQTPFDVGCGEVGGVRLCMLALHHRTESIRNGTAANSQTLMFMHADDSDDRHKNPNGYRNAVRASRVYLKDEELSKN